MKRRIKQLVNREVLAMGTEAEEARQSTIKMFIQKFAKNIRTTENTRQKIERILESAGIPIRVEEFITIRIFLFALAVIVSFIFGINLIGALIIGFLGWRLPYIYIKRKMEKRITKAGAQLPQTLEIMASSMKSGYSFMQAMQLVAKELPDPIGVEFLRTIKDINYGMPMEMAFENLLKRIPNRDLEIVTTAILIQRTTGGNLAKILESIQDTIADRVRMKDELRALTSQGRMSALIITLLPVGLGILLSIMNPKYFTPMLQNPFGWVLIAGGVISGTLGWIFINKVVTIEV